MAAKKNHTVELCGTAHVGDASILQQEVYQHLGKNDRCCGNIQEGQDPEEEVHGHVEGGVHCDHEDEKVPNDGDGVN